MTAGKKKTTVVAGAATGLLIVCAAFLPMLASPRGDDVREIGITVRDMAFYVDGQPEPNPAIVLKAGEQVRVRVRNQEAGMAHDFTVKAWSIGSRRLEDRGEEDTILIRVPAERGDTRYVCTPHAKMMSGTIRVE